MADGHGIPVLRPRAGDVVHLDVDFCDVVPPNRDDTELQLRIKGRQVGEDGRQLAPLVCVFVDAASAEISLRRARLLRGPLPELPAGETVQPVKLMRKQITVRRVASRNGWTSIDIRPREGAIQTEDEEVLADYRWALAHARNEFVPSLEADRFPVGAAELLMMADSLATARRRIRHISGHTRG